MRPPERIDEIIELLRENWKQDPDMRFMQLIYVMQSFYSGENKQVGQIQVTDKDGSKRTGYDLFHVEDTKFKDFLERFLKRNERRV